MTGAEVLVATATTLLAAVIALSYLADVSGLGILPVESAIAAMVAAAMVLLVFQRRVRWTRLDVALLAGVLVAVCGLLLWLAWPSLLPPGSRPELTHHLLLVDDIERHGHVVHDATAGASRGEMVHDAPGLHLLAVVAGAVTRSDGFHAIYPVVAVAVALKVGVVFLILLRLLSQSSVRELFAVAGVLWIVTASIYSVGSFTRDALLAQVVSELFAVWLWWVLSWWDVQPSRGAMVLFAVAGVAVVLTWPLWMGPPVLALVALTLLRRDMSRRRKIGHLALALGPIVVVAIVHIIGAGSMAGIAGTGGGGHQPSPAMLGTWLPLLAFLGLVSAAGDWRYRTLIVFSGAIVTQAAALWVVGKASGAGTADMPNMMTSLAIYPGIAAMMVALAKGWRLLAPVARPAPAVPEPRPRQIAWAVLLTLGVLIGSDAARRWKTAPVVSTDLWEAGRWAREHVPASCVDYLVGNESTAYWLHVAVLGNPLASVHTADRGTLLTDPSIAQWIVRGGHRYAIANLTILPSEMRGDIDVLHQTGAAAVIARRVPTSTAQCPTPTRE